MQLSKGQKQTVMVARKQARRPQSGARRNMPQRQCVVCRTSRPTFELLQLSAVPLPEKPPSDDACSATGRRAYVCIGLPCLRALQERRLGHALRTTVALGTPAQWVVGLQQLAQQRLYELLGLARRQGVALLGASRVYEAAPETVACVLVAADASARVGQDLSHAGYSWQQIGCLTMTELGNAVGHRPLASVGFGVGRLGTQAAYWSGVWYETTRLDTTTQATDASETSGKAPSDQPADVQDLGTPNARRIEVAR